jgi:hypothetical protein
VGAAILSHVVVVHWNIIPYTIYCFLRPVQRGAGGESMQFTLYRLMAGEGLPGQGPCFEEKSAGIF